MTAKMPSVELTNRFIKGLKEYNLAYDEMVNWKYCGGNRGRHLSNFKLCCKGEELPNKVYECICGHAIIENCYITNGDEILVLGNCCIKRFIEKSDKTCEICEEPHKNRKVNRCNKCRIGICDDCGKKCDEDYKKCYSCAFK